MVAEGFLDVYGVCRFSIDHRRYARNEFPLVSYL
jgi:hypothetical protein